MAAANEKSIIARRNAVERIALASGYPKWRAEDIAQEAALQLLSNPNLRSQSNKQAYIDAIRGGVEREYTRRGEFVVPIFESHFEEYSNLVNGLRSPNDLEREQIVSSELSDLRNGFKILKPWHRDVLNARLEGYSLAEISKRYGCSESRIGQIVKFSTVRVKEAVVSNRLSQQEQGKRKQQESATLPREVQDRFWLYRETKRAMANVSEIEGFRVESFKIPKIPQEIFSSF